MKIFMVRVQQRHLFGWPNYFQWSTEVYTPKTREIYRKSDADEGLGKKIMRK